MNLSNRLGNQAGMALLILVAALISCFTSCKDEPFEVNLDRANAISFRLDTFDLVVTNDVVFYEGPQVLHVFSDSSRVLFQRISLQAHGMTPSSLEYWLIVDFDTYIAGDAVGKYTMEYDPEKGGIDEMRLIIDNEGTMIEFTSLPGLNTVYFQVDAQKHDERIMKGVFGGILYRDGNQAGQASLLNDGVFTDIKY